MPVTSPPRFSTEFWDSLSRVAAPFVDVVRRRLDACDDPRDVWMDLLAQLPGAPSMWLVHCNVWAADTHNAGFARDEWGRLLDWVCEHPDLGWTWAVLGIVWLAVLS